MTTHTVSHHPVRSDVPVTDAADPSAVASAEGSARWALAGVGAGALGAAAVVTSLQVDAIYDPDLRGDTAGQADRLAEQIPQIAAFHVLAGLSAVLLVVFAAGLHRRLRAAAPGSIAPMVAFAGMLGTSVIVMLGAGLNTEFMFGLAEDGLTDPVNAVFFGHWIATIPWVWGLTGLAGLAVFSAGRDGTVPRWIALVGLLLGGLTLLAGISPAQYMAGFTGPVLVLVLALGFLVGDRAHRGRG
ncbi:hypothetical protein [Nocardioides sp. SYSU DS0651]|uniref:hypothetical protein n=1 Tax=Nocardioides sp. SYSU DS0651 TaxID=3415955 RepID=UPI003F4B9910